MSWSSRPLLSHRHFATRIFNPTPPLKERSITVREILESSKQLRSEMILGWHVQNSLQSNSCPCHPHLPNHSYKTNHRISRGYFAFLLDSEFVCEFSFASSCIKTHDTNNAFLLFQAIRQRILKPFVLQFFFSV